MAVKTRDQRSKEGYESRSPAISVTVYDPTGRVLCDDVATEVLNAIRTIVKKNNLHLDFTRT